MDDLRLYQDLPPSLATRLAIAVHRRIVVRAPFLCALSDEALLGVLTRLKAVVYVPKQVVLVEGQPVKTIFFVKKGKVALVHHLGTPAEQEVRTVGPSDHFGMQISATGQYGGDVTDTDVAEQLLKPQMARESARAEAYCDIVTLAAHDLAEVFTHEQLWTKLALRRNSEHHAPQARSRMNRRPTLGKQNTSPLPLLAAHCRASPSIGGQPPKEDALSNALSSTAWAPPSPELFMPSPAMTRPPPPAAHGPRKWISGVCSMVRPNRGSPLSR